MTWVTALLLGQIRKPFPTAGEVEMRRLQFWAGSAEGRPARARALAVQMIHTMRDMFGAKYEPGKTFASALMTMTTVLVVAGKSLADLAEATDGELRFLEETE